MESVRILRLEAILNGAIALEEKFDDVEAELSAGVRTKPTHMTPTTGPHHHLREDKELMGHQQAVAQQTNLVLVAREVGLEP